MNLSTRSKFDRLVFLASKSTKALSVASSKDTFFLSVRVLVFCSVYVQNPPLEFESKYWLRQQRASLFWQIKNRFWVAENIRLQSRILSANFPLYRGAFSCVNGPPLNDTFETKRLHLDAK